MFNYSKEHAQMFDKFEVDVRHSWRAGKTRMVPDPSGRVGVDGKVVLIPYRATLSV